MAFSLSLADMRNNSPLLTTQHDLNGFQQNRCCAAICKKTDATEMVSVTQLLRWAPRVYPERRRQ